MRARWCEAITSRQRIQKMAADAFDISCRESNQCGHFTAADSKNGRGCSRYLVLGILPMWSGMHLALDESQVAWHELHGWPF
jgi:hypothetical protein